MFGHFVENLQSIKENVKNIIFAVLEDFSDKNFSSIFFVSHMIFGGGDKYVGGGY